MKTRKFKMLGYDVVELSPHWRIIKTPMVEYIDGFARQKTPFKKIFLPYCEFFFKIYPGCKIPLMHFAFSTKELRRKDQELLLPPFHNILVMDAMCCCRATIEDWWGSLVTTSNYTIPYTPFKSSEGFFNSTEDECWEAYHNWPENNDFNDCEFKFTIKSKIIDGKKHIQTVLPYQP